jgi:hypothetical protein
MPEPSYFREPLLANSVIAVWPCDHGNVQVEPGPARPGYRCHECGATATTYVSVDAIRSGRVVADEADNHEPLVLDLSTSPATMLR